MAVLVSRRAVRGIAYHWDTDPTLVDTITEEPFGEM